MTLAAHHLFSTEVFIGDWFSARKAELVELPEADQRELRLDMASPLCITEKVPPMKCEICQRRLAAALALLEKDNVQHRVEGTPPRFIVFPYPPSAGVSTGHIVLFLAQMFVGWRVRCVP